MKSLQEIMYELQQSQFHNYTDEKRNLINQIEFIQNLEYEIREKYEKMKQIETNEPEEGGVIFEEADF